MNIRIYKPKTSNTLMTGLTVLAIVCILTIVKVVNSASGVAMDSGQWIGIVLFWACGLAITILPFGFTLEVGDDYIKSYFFGFGYGKIGSSDIQALEYGDLFHGNLGFGEGLIIRYIVNGQSKTTSIGERAYGKGAIEEVKRVLAP